MRKFTLLVLFCCASLLSQAQTTRLAYKEKHNYNNRLTPEAAMTNAWRWFDANTHTTPDAAEAKMRDAHGIFKGVGSFPFVSKVASGNDFSRGTVFFTVYLRVHDTEGAYTFIITDIAHQGRVSLNALTTDAKYPYRVEGDRMWHNMVWKDLREQAEQHVKQLAASLTAAMETPSVISQRGKAPKIIVVNN